jgi:hypothetical protein
MTDANPFTPIPEATWQRWLSEETSFQPPPAEERSREELKRLHIQVLMRDGKWLVPRLQRPPGWKKMMRSERPVMQLDCEPGDSK